MHVRSIATLLLAALVAGVAAFAGPEPVLAARKQYEDKKLGFKIRIEDSYTQNPPKLTADESFLVGDWYEDSAKFERSLPPTFQILWFVEPKGVPPGPPPEAEAPASEPDPAAPKDGPPAKDDPAKKEPPPPKTKEELAKEREARRPKTLDQALDRFFSATTGFFGAAVPMAERWKSAESDKTGGRIPLDIVEINAPVKKKKDQGNGPRAYAFVARLVLDRPREVVHVGFLGYCSTDHVKSYSKEFPAIARSFEALKKASDSRNELAGMKLSDDPAVRREQIRKAKLVPGWKSVDTENYILIHHADVEASLVRSIGNQIEAIREQVYEVLFPPDRPLTDVSIVRVCKDDQQYYQYGGPGGSAGYWNDDAEELVFYDMNSKDSLRVLYHEAFHQYIYYSVGDFAPHSWFNEGHGDYFAGHNYVGGRFVRDTFAWRVALARAWKKNPKRPPLREWVNWTQMQYYGRNKEGVGPGPNYALGWSLVYFLRTTKKPEYQGVLDRYFKSLKGAVSRGREAREAWEKKLKDAKDKGLPPPEKGDTSDVGTEDQWLKTANSEAFQGIDWDQIEKDWLASDN